MSYVILWSWKLTHPDFDYQICQAGFEIWNDFSWNHRQPGCKIGMSEFWMDQIENWDHVDDHEDFEID